MWNDAVAPEPASACTRLISVAKFARSSCCFGAMEFESSTMKRMSTLVRGVEIDRLLHDREVRLSDGALAGACGTGDRSDDDESEGCAHADYWLEPGRSVTARCTDGRNRLSG